MVASWEKDGRAYSNIEYDDDAFYKAIKTPHEKLGITSQSGNDLLYYDTNIYGSDKDAIRRNRNKTESKRPISRKLESKLRLKVRGIVENVMRE